MAASKRNRYSRTLTGLNAIGFVSPQTALYAGATYQAFVASAATAAQNGQIAIVLYPSMVPTVTLIPTGAQFFIAQIVDGDIKKTPIMTFDGLAAGYTNYIGPNLVYKKAPYLAPVFQSTALGWNGTAGDLGLVAGTVAAPLTYSVSARDTSPSSQPFPVQSGTIKSTISTATKTELTLALAADFVNATDFEKSSDIMFVTADVKTNGTATPIAVVTATFINGSNIVTYSAAHTLAVGDILEVTATGFSYKVVTINSATVATLDRPYQGASFTTAAGGTAKKTVITATGLYITSVTEDTQFLLSYSGLPITIPPTVITAWRQGSGAPWQTRSIEEDTAVMSGYTNANMAWAQDMGQPTFFTTNPETSALQYDTYFFNARKTTASMAFVNEQTAATNSYVILAVPNAGGPAATLVTVFGV